MNRLNPEKLFHRIAADIPVPLHQHTIVTGSLAAAYEFRAKLDGNAVNTKDADLVIHPVGNEQACVRMAQELLEIGWTRTSACYPQLQPSPTVELRAIRLCPPNSTEYFVEFLTVPGIGQKAAKEWIPVKLSDGWYGLPGFRFMGVVELACIRSTVGIEYAHPAMMALSNLLSHPEVGTDRIESGEMQGILRSAKDLGRILALAHLTERVGTEAWVGMWVEAFGKCFPREQSVLAKTLGAGLEELLDDRDALGQAHQTTDVGLLSGMNVTSANLRATGLRLIGDVIDPVRSDLARLK